MTVPALPTASDQDGTYPRPQLMRPDWHDLTGRWDFGYGDTATQSPDTAVFDRTITVPYPPESPLSGIGDTRYHPVVWYRRTFAGTDITSTATTDDQRTILHFGAVDWAADIWLNDRFIGNHQGGQAPFSFDITDTVTTGQNTLIVRAFDDPHDVTIPRGKQDWLEAPHSIWYHRTTGIWQPVWLETVPAHHITGIYWNPDIPAATVQLELDLNLTPPKDTWAAITLTYGTELLAEGRFRLTQRTSQLSLTIDRQRNGQHYEELLWSPEHPRLIDAVITIHHDDRPGDTIASYLGLRTVAATHRQFLLNDRPYYLRGVLSQNYWPESHYAAPNPGALRREVELIKQLGFNTARVHQKAEDPRFAYWADKLGLLLWGETASAYEFSARAVTALTTEWLTLIRRDRSHPSIVVWVPFNESWGLQHIANDPQQQAFSRALTDLTRALDPTRPVISNDGWEHTNSDITTIHDYDADPETLTNRYATPAAIHELLDGYGPNGRRITISPQHPDHPVMLTEFGGVSYAPQAVEGAWGYSTATDAQDFQARVTGLLHAARSSPLLSGYCYTQLTDTGQETNGLLTADRSPKIPIGDLRRAIAQQ